jgi:hypothetical protein
MRINLRSWPPYQRLRAFEYALACRLRALELRTGTWRTALLVATAGMLLACLYPRRGDRMVRKTHGRTRRNPLPVGVENDLAYRVLTPLVSYLVGLRGEGVVITNLLFAWLLLMILYRELRRSRVSSYYASLCTTS